MLHPKRVPGRLITDDQSLAGAYTGIAALIDNLERKVLATANVRQQEK